MMEMLNQTQYKLIEALDRLTPSVGYHQQERDHADAGKIAQEAGLARVGEPDTRMAIAMRELRQLEKLGLVARVKAEADQTIRYRLTQLGERHLLREAILHLDVELLNEKRAYGELQERLRQTEQELGRRVLEAQRPFWKKALRIA